MSNPFRPHFERDLDDVLIFMKEALIVMWRFNPAGVAAYLCGQLFESINDATPSDQKAAMVAETLGGIEIVPVETFENDFSTTIAEVCNGISGATIKSAVKAYPQIEEFLRESVGNQNAGLTDSFTRLTRAAVTKQRPHYQQLVPKLALVAERTKANRG